MVTKKLFIGLIVFILLIGFITSENWVFDDVNHNENDIFNLTNLNATNGNFENNVNASRVNSFFNWTSISNFLSFDGFNLDFLDSVFNSTYDNRWLNIEDWNATNDSYLLVTNWNSTNQTYDENNDSLTNYINSNNQSVNNYIDSQDILFNDSNNNYILDNNNSVNNYILFTNGTQSSWSIGTFVNITGDTMTGDLTLPNLTATNNITVRNHLDVEGNLTLGQKITFAFGEVIDNIVDGFIGITGNLDMNVGNITEVGYIDFDLIANASHMEGRIHWNDEDKTLDIDTNINGVSLQTGQEMYLYARNNLGFQITNGQLVYVIGAMGNRPMVALAKADAESTSAGTIGMATHDCDDNSICFFTTEGLVRDLDTSLFTANDSIFLSPDIAGGFTNVEPEAPNHSVRLGHVLRSNANDGIIHLRIMNGDELNELHDVHYPTSTVNGNILVWNDSMSRWENGNVINNNLNVTQNLTIGERIIQNNYSIFPVVVNDDVLDSVFCLEMKSPTGQKQCKLAIQPGGSGQASIIRRSLGIVNDDICTGVNATNMQCYADVGGFTWNIDFNTSISGADLGIADDLEVIGDVYLKDTEGETHFLSRTLQLLDELFEDIFFNDANLSIVNGVLNINDTLNETLVVNLNRSETIFTTTSDSISLNSGTDLNPSINHVSYQNPSNPTLTIDTSEPSSTHAEVSVIYVGSSMNNIYLFENTISHNEHFVDQVYDSFSDLGGIYLNGLNTLVNSTTINITTGEVRLRLNKISYTNNLNSVSDGFFYIDNSGDFIQCTDNSCLTDYVDGTSISNNKYYSIVWGSVPVGKEQRLMAILQSNPGSGKEYTSAISAEEDPLSKVNFFPSNTDFKVAFIPIARTIHRRTGNNDFITFPTTGELFQDLRGKATVSSGGVPSPPISDHSMLDNLEWINASHIFNLVGQFFDIGSYNLTTTGNITGDYFFGDGSQLTGITAGIGNSTSWNRSGTNVFLANSGDSVGIGTSNPIQKFEVNETTANITIARFIFNGTHNPGSTGSAGIQFENTDITPSSIGGFTFSGADAGGTDRHTAAIMSGKEGDWIADSGNYPGFLSFWTRPTSGEEIERLRINEEGNVGIGTANPGNLLDVEGVGIFNGLHIGLTGGTGAITGLDITQQAGGAGQGIDLALSGSSAGRIFLNNNKLHIIRGTGESAGITIDSSARVGIGTTNPTHELNVIGDGNFTGSVYALGQNLSEVIESNNNSMKNYVDFQDLLFNNSIVNWITSTYYTITQIDAMNDSNNNYINSNNVSVTNAIASSGGPFTTNVYTITGWNMDATMTKSVTISESIVDVRSVKVIIINDLKTLQYDLFGSSANKDGWMNFMSSTSIQLARRTGGVFDNVNFNSAGTKGWIVIESA